MRVVCIIPARVGSTRLPDKPLQRIGSEPLISIVARRAVHLGFASQVIVAGDDERVLEAVAGIPGIVGLLTSRTPKNGTERVAEVVFGSQVEADVIVNLQGDEPFVPEAAVAGLMARLAAGDDLATVAGPLDAGDVPERSVVKVLVQGGVAGAFARDLPRTAHRWAGDGDGWGRHIGIYGYRPDALRRWMEAPESRSEREQRLEQLRPLEYGHRMGVAMIREPVPPGIDTPDDLIRAERYLETSMESVGA